MLTFAHIVALNRFDLSSLESHISVIVNVNSKSTNQFILHDKYL